MLPIAELKKTLAAYTAKRIELSEYPDFKRAAVLVPLFQAQEGLSLILTKRTDLVDTHKGQVSFPGGMFDKTDSDLVATALREAREEIGVNSAHIDVLGMLDEHPVPSKFIITPVIGYLPKRPSITPHAAEVAEVFDVPLSFFADSANCWTEEREFRGEKRMVWFYSYENRIIWGATAAIILNLLSVLSSFDLTQR